MKPAARSVFGKRLWPFFISMSILGSAYAADRYAAPNGSSTGSGSITSPWDLKTALSSASAGDTVWLRGGTYPGNFLCWASGTTTSPIIYRQYPGERARVDGGSSTGSAVGMMCQNVWLWGFEIFFSNTQRISSQTGSFPTDIYRGAGITTGQVAGTPLNLKFINMIIHDSWGSFGVWKEASGAEIYGNLIYYDGWNAPDRGHGHGIYTQNDGSKTTKVFDNIIFSEFSHGIHVYAGDPLMNNYDIEGNISFDNGAIGTGGYARNMLVGAGSGGDIPQNVIIKNNFTYYSPSKSGGESAKIGTDLTGCTNITVTGNYFVAQNGTALNIPAACTSISVTGNTILGSLSGFSPSLYPNNSYYTGFSRPTGANVFVRPNAYEPGRANIAVYNWDMAATVQADVSQVLRQGDQYQVIDAENYWGSPVATGTYSGGTISLPMTLSVVTPLVGSGGISPTHTSTEFGAFILVRTGTGTVNLAPVVNAGPDQTVTSTATLNGTVSDDGLPTGASVTAAWSVDSGPGQVTFANRNSAATTASFSLPGTYVLRLTASDTQLSSSDTATITVQSNTGPIISALAVSSISTSSAVVKWTTSSPATTQLAFGTVGSAMQSTTLNSTLVSSHSVTLSSLQAGTTYNFAAISTDSSGNKSTSPTSTFATSIASPSPGPILVPASAAARTAPMTTFAVSDPPSTSTVGITSNTANSGLATFTVSVPVSGTYVIWGRVLVPSANADSWYVSVNNGPEDIYDAGEHVWSNVWQWTVVNGRNGGAPLTLNPRKFTLNAGYNTIVFRGREAGSMLDALIITNDLAYKPK